MQTSKTKNEPKGAELAAAPSKRKTYTSTAVKARYNAKTYDRLQISVKKEIAAAYKAKCNALGISYSEPLHNAIEKFISE